MKTGIRLKSKYDGDASLSMLQAGKTFPLPVNSKQYDPVIRQVKIKRKAGEDIDVWVPRFSYGYGQIDPEVYYVDQDKTLSSSCAINEIISIRLYYSYVKDEIKGEFFDLYTDFSSAEITALSVSALKPANSITLGDLLSAVETKEFT